MNTEPTVFIVDDDAAALDSLDCLLRSVGLQVQAYSSPSQFLQEYDPTRPGCIVLDVRMPELSGLELQQELLLRGSAPPILVVTGHADVPVCAAAFRAGAFDFIEKPVNHQLLLGRIQRAIEVDSVQRRHAQLKRTMEDRVNRLTPREREVMTMIVDGHSLKQVSALLGISGQTAAKHRARVLEKLEVTTDAALTRAALIAQGDQRLLSSQ
ncbi:MAG TPA: response regulator [Lacipirellulaceae bacterium]|nr:response regulator [Lacipirellulaceae bacterium]